MKSLGVKKLRMKLQLNLLVLQQRRLEAHQRLLTEAELEELKPARPKNINHLLPVLATQQVKVAMFGTILITIFSSHSFGHKFPVAMLIALSIGYLGALSCFEFWRDRISRRHFSQGAFLIAPIVFAAYGFGWGYSALMTVLSIGTTTVCLIGAVIEIVAKKGDRVSTGILRSGMPMG